MLEHPLQFLAAQGSELVDEADPRVQLGVARESFPQTRHANKHHPHVAAVVEVTELFKACGFQTVSFIDHEQVWRLTHHGCVGIAIPGSAWPPDRRVCPTSC